MVYNPATYLEDLLLRICEVKETNLSDYNVMFMDGTPITKLNVTLAELGVFEIKFLDRTGASHFLRLTSFHLDKRSKVKREKSSTKKDRSERVSVELPGSISMESDVDMSAAFKILENGELLSAGPLKWHTLLQNLLSLESWRVYFVRKGGFNLFFEALGFLENKLRSVSQSYILLLTRYSLDPEPAERLFTQLSLCLYCLQALSNQQTPLLRTSFPVRLLLDAFRFTDMDYTVVLFDLIR